MKTKEQNVQENFSNLGKLTTEQLESLARKMLLSYGEANQQSKKSAAEKKQLREKYIPVLRALRSRMSRRGSGEWQAWFEENKANFGGVTVRTVNGWLGDIADRKKFVCVDSADGITLNKKKYAFTVEPNANGTLTITATPYAKEEPAAEPQPVAADGLAANSTLGRSPYKDRKTHAVKQWGTGEANQTICGKQVNDGEGTLLVSLAAKDKTTTCKVCANHPEYQGMVQRRRLYRNERRRDARRAAKAAQQAQCEPKFTLEIAEKANEEATQ